MAELEKSGILREMMRGLERIFFPGWLVNRRVRITGVGAFYLGLVFLFSFAAINTGNNLLYLLLAVMLSILIASFWLSEMVLNDLRLSRRLPETVVAGEEFFIIYQLLNQKKFFPLAGISVQEKIGKKIAQAYFPLVAPGKTEQVYAKASLERRGRAEFSELTISTRFPFGFFEKGKRVKLKDELVVLPSPVLTELDSPALPGQPGIVYTGKKGTGSELFCYKPYLPGDPPHFIDWKASARSAQMLVKENEQEAEQSLVIVLNISWQRPEPDSLARENLIRKAFGLAQIYLDQGFRVRVEIQKQGIDFGAGILHLKKIGLWLALFDDPKNPDRGEKLPPLTFSCPQCILGLN